MFKNLSLEALGISGRESDVIELALSHGFKGLDLDFVDFAEQVNTQGMAKAARLIVSARLKIGGFPVPVRWEGSDAEYRADLERLPALAEIAKQLSGTRARATIAPANDTRPFHENFELYRRRLAEVGDLLAGFNIRLGIAFLAPAKSREGFAFRFVQTAEEALLLLRSVSSNNVGLALDSWQWHIGGGKLEQLQALKPEKIVTVALADADPSATAADVAPTARLLPGATGAVDNVGLLAILAEMRYDGPITPAPDQSQFAGLGRDKIVKNCGAALDAIWKTAGLNNAGRLATVSGR